jgi:small subunit ribosomal protein S8
VLKNYHYIKDFSIKDDLVIVELMYNEEGIPAFRVLQAISKPGLKIYRPYKRFREHVSAPGMLIVSTSEGIMSHKEAVQKKIGGKVLCLVA